MLTLDKVYKASHVLKEVIRETDLIKAPKINKEAEVYLKTENLQVTGSFKVRGAYFKISQLSDEEKAPAPQETTRRALLSRLPEPVSSRSSACPTARLSLR